MSDKQNQQENKSNGRFDNAKDKMSSASEKLSYGNVKSDLRRFWNALMDFVKSFLPILLQLFVGSVGLIEAVGLDTGAPDPYVPYLVYYGYAVWVTLPYWELIRQKIAKDNRKRLFVYNPETSKYERWAIPKEKWYDMTYVDPEGNPMTVGDVDRIITAKFGESPLVRSFDPDTLTATVTWLAGKNEIDLRASKEQLKEMTKTTWAIAESAIRALANRDNIAKKSAMREIATSIKHREDINLDSSTELTDFESILQDNDILEDDVVKNIQEEISDMDFDDEDL